MEAFDYATSLPNKASKRSWMYWNISGPNSPRATYQIHHCSLPNPSRHPRIHTQKYQVSPMDTAMMDYKFTWLPPDDTRCNPPRGPLDNTPNPKQWPSPDGRFSSSRIYHQRSKTLNNTSSMTQVQAPTISYPITCNPQCTGFRIDINPLPIPTTTSLPTPTVLSTS